MPLGPRHQELRLRLPDADPRRSRARGHRHRGRPRRRGIAVGDHVIGSTAGYCGYCASCLRGARAWCTNLAPLVRAEGEAPRVAARTAPRCTSPATSAPSPSR
nr:alcohol dehydrogenase catalytic domain-containing protein [Brachybacterium aquaticum]